jgi:hypothetical protein
VIERVLGVERHPVHTDTVAITPCFNKPFLPIMAWFAEALQGSEPERLRIASMRYHVVGDLGEGGSASCLAQATPGLDAELVFSPSDPACFAIPGIPGLMVAIWHYPFNLSASAWI